MESKRQQKLASASKVIPEEPARRMCQVIFLEAPTERLGHLSKLHPILLEYNCGGSSDPCGCDAVACTCFRDKRDFAGP